MPQFLTSSLLRRLSLAAVSSAASTSGTAWFSVSRVPGRGATSDNRSRAFVCFNFLAQTRTLARSIGIDQIGTVTARVGYAWDRTMLYAKAGWAGVRVSARARDLVTGEYADFTDLTTGWTVGVGMEHVPWQSIVLGVEANFYDISGFDHSGADTFGVPARFFNTSAPIWAISLRASYLFGPPIVTRYVN